MIRIIFTGMVFPNFTIGYSTREVTPVERKKERYCIEFQRFDG